jgi:hypothetical protein
VDRLAADQAAEPVAAAGTGVEMAVGTVGGTAAGVINVAFSGEHDFAAQGGILTRPFARLLSSSDVASQIVSMVRESTGHRLFQETKG